MSSAIQYGFTAKARDERVGPRLLRITDIQNNAVTWSDVPFCEIGEEDKAKYLLRENDLVFARTGATVGKSYLIRGVIPESVFASYLIRVRLKDDVEPRYVAHFFQSAEYWRQVGASRSGIGQPNVNGKKLAQIQIPIAPLEQQKRIVAELEKQFSRLDEAVANLKRVKANLKRYRAAVLKAAVEGRLVPTEAELARREGRTYETGEQLLARILIERRAAWENHTAVVRKKEYMDQQPSDNLTLSDLSDGWAWASIGLLGDVIGGLTKNPKRAMLKTRLPYLRVANVYANELRLGEMECIGVDDKELDKLLVRKGDLLIVEGNGSQDQIGRVAIWDGSINPCVHQNHLIKVRLLGGCLPGWVLLWLLSPAGRNLVTDIASSTSGLYTLSVGKVAVLSVPLPSLPEQRRIVAEVDRRLSMADESEAQVEAGLRRAEGLRRAILKQAFEARLG